MNDVIRTSKTNGDLWQEAFDWAQENIKNAERYSTTETRAKAQDAYMAATRSTHETNELLSIAQKVEPGELEQLRRIDQAARKFVEKAESRGEWKSYPEWGELNTAIFDGSPTQKAEVCVCGEPNTQGITHRTDGPCFVAPICR